MKTNFDIQKTVRNSRIISAMRVFRYVHCLGLTVCALLMGSLQVWGDAITTEILDFGTPIVSETFESCSTSDETSLLSANASLSTFGIFDRGYNNSTSNHYLIESNATFGSNSLKLSAGSGSPLVLGKNSTSFGTSGVLRFKTLKAAKNMYFGIYDDYCATAEIYAAARSSLYLQCTSGTIYLNSGSGWVSAGTYTTDVIDVCVIYNNTNSETSYGNSISLASTSAHVFINGSAVMNDAGTAPKDFVIPGKGLDYLRITIAGASGNLAYIDDIKIYDALPTVAGDAITLHKNNDDASGSTSGSARIVADGTSMISLSAPTRTGYEVEGYYTTSACATKVATSAGALQAGITVDATTWTNESSQWKKGGDATFYTKWTAKTYTVTLNDNTGSGGSGSKTVTFNANTNMTSAVTIPTKTHYIFGGYWTSSDAGTTLTTQVINADGTWKASVSGYTDATPNWIYAGDVTLYAKWTEHTYTNYKTRCCDPTGLAFGSTYYTLTREDIQGSTTVWDTISITFSTSSSGTVTAVDNNGGGKTAWQFTGSGTWETRATTGGTAASTDNHAVFKITDAANGKAIFCVKNNGGNTGQGTYRFGLTQAADGSYCESTVWCWADVTVRDKFVDAVNGNSTINRDGHGPGGEQMKTPAEADLTDVDECHETTRRLRGWIKETDLQTQYNDASKETGYLEDAANYNSSQIIAPYANITTSGCTWYAVWGEEE